MAEQTPDVKKQETKVKRSPSAKKQVEAIKRFFLETKSEMKKIVWPTPRQVVNNTIIVVLTILIVGMFIWILDACTSSLLSTLLKSFK